MKNPMLAAYVTRQGVGHTRINKPNEDCVSFEMLPDNRGVVAAVSDGAGSAPRAREGSNLAAKAAVHQAVASIIVDEEDDPAIAVAAGLKAAQEAIEQSALAINAQMEDYHCTLILVAWLDDQVAAIQVGDGAVIVESTGACKMLTIPQRGQYANETYFVTEPHCEKTQFTNQATGITALALFTDGIQKSAVDFRNRKANEDFIPQAIAMMRDQETGSCPSNPPDDPPEDVVTKGIMAGPEWETKDMPQLGASLFHWLNEQVGHPEDDMTLIIVAKLEDA